MPNKIKEEIEAIIGSKIYRGWILEGAGPARFGWYTWHPCKKVFLGRTLAEISESFELSKS